MNNPIPRASRRVRFEEVTPAHEYAAFFNVSIAPLVAHLGIPIFDGYDDLDDLQLAFLTLPSGETVTLGEYAGMPGTSLYIEVAMQSIPQIIFDSCQQLRVSRQELEWVHPDRQIEFDQLYAEGKIEGIDRSSIAESSQSKDREPIDCFFHALEIYTRPKFPEHWAMLQHNLGLAYFDRNKGERWENLQKSIECYHNSLEVFTQDKFPKKWQINQEDLSQSMETLKLEKQNLVKDTTEGTVIILSATEEYILSVIWGHSQGVYGLDILNQINKANKENNRREIGMGSLYPALKRMEQQGLVTARWGEEALGEESGGARRRYYTISADGAIALNTTQSYRQQLSSSSIFAI
jgi:DNA-binding PadR family transcriptional regulator